MRMASRRPAGIVAIAFALAVPRLALADQQPVAIHPATAVAAPAAPQVPAHPRVSFDFLNAPAAPGAAPTEHRTGLAALAERVQATAHRLNDPHALRHWGYSHGQVTFSLRTP